MAKNTIATLTILTVLLLSLGLASAYTSTQDGIKVTTTTELPNPVVPGSTHDVLVNVTNNNGTTISLAWTDTAATSGITATVPADSTLADGTSQEYTITYSIPADFEGTASHKVDLVTDAATFHPYSAANNIVDVTGCMDPNANNYDSTATINATCTYDEITADTFCELEDFTEKGDLEISDFDVNNKGEGSDDEWEFLDQIEIAVDVENTGNDDIDDVEVKIVILDDKIELGGNDVTNDFDFEDEVLTDIGKLKDDDEESVTFLIEELSSDLDDGTYYMYIMAYEDGNEAEQCTSEIDSGDFYYSFDIESVDYEDSIVVKGSEFEEIIDTYCDQKNLEITVPVYNLGDEEEERILVNLYDSEMGIDEYIVIEDLDNGDKEIVTFFINVPSDLAKEKYNLDVIVSFDWDDDEDDEDPLSYDEENSEASIRLNILGCKVAAPSITASLDSATELGQNLIVKTTITNNGNLADFVIAPMEFESWADLVSVTPGKATIASGNTQEIIITLSPKEAGAHTFKISTIVDGEIYNQPVSVKISEEPGMFSSLGLSNTMLYLIAGIAALLVLIFFVLIVKVARRPARAAEF